MLGALLSFCLMAVAARELSGELDTFQVLLFRSLIGLAVISGVITVLGQWHKVKTGRFSLHLARNSIHLLGQYGWLLAIGLLPLAEVFAIEFTVPFWTAILAFVLLKEQLTLRKLLAITLGFSGVVIIAQPSFSQIDFGLMIMVGAAIAYALAHVTTKALTKTESPISIIFYMSAIQLPISFVLALDTWQMPTGYQFAWLTVIGLTSLTAHYCISNAMKHADASVVVTLDFLRLPAIALIGALLYSEALSIALFVGAALMLLANWINTK